MANAAAVTDSEQEAPRARGLEAVMIDQDRLTLRCDLLGPLRVHRNGQPVAFASLPQQVLFAVLALHANRPVGRDQLIDSVWGSTVPTYAVNLVQKRMSELRRVLEPDRSPGVPSTTLSWTERGYVLSLPEDGLDLWEHRRELDRARAERAKGDLHAAADATYAALRLWRGSAFEGLSSPLLDAERDRLSEARTTATEDRIELELALGTDVELVAELRRLVAEHPLRDRLRGLLMLALYRGGRQAEALDVYHAARGYLRDELGIDPGGELQALYAQILNVDPSLATPATPGVQAGVKAEGQWRVVPAELPHGLPHFAGRAEELDRLDSLVAGDAAQQTVIVAIAGTAGVGKTSLAVHWAHRVRDQYPDGQLYVNLRGFDPTGSIVEPADAIRGFLDALVLGAKRVPVSLEAQGALFRSLLAGRRMLIVLDNARHAEHVRPLLPGTPGCLVIVTSRNQLAGLVATDGAHPFDVGLLSPDESRRLLQRRLGSDRVATDPTAVAEIISACARLPLALTIAAARAAAHPTFPLAALAEELRDARLGLDAFGGDDEMSDVRAVFSWSYLRLSPEARRLFRLLGVHPPGPDVSRPAAASLARLTLRHLRALLNELTAANLLIERRPGRFGMHDLLRAYATELAWTDETEPERQAAVERALDFYLHTAYAADRLLNPYRQDPIILSPPRDGVSVLEIGTHRAAIAWFVDEHAVLMAAIRQSSDLGLGGHTWRLAWALTDYFEFQARWRDALVTFNIALDAARRADDLYGEALVHHLRSRPLTRTAQYDEALGELDQARHRFEASDDLHGRAHVQLSKAWVLERQGNHVAALSHAKRALELFREVGARSTGEARALNAVGWFHGLLGDHERAVAFCQEALALQQMIGDVHNEAETWDSLGFIHHGMDRQAESVESYQRAIDLYRQLDDRYNEADTLASLGGVYRAGGRVSAAREVLTRALLILDRLEHPDADVVRVQLADLEVGA